MVPHPLQPERACDDTDLPARQPIPTRRTGRQSATEPKTPL